MSDKLELHFARLEAVLGEIERLTAEIGYPCGQESDREALDIVRSIERRMAASRRNSC